MYVKPVYRPEHAGQAHDVIEGAVFGTLVAQGPDGLVATHLPFMVDRDRGPFGTLVSHLAAANPHAELVRAGAEMLAIFVGPEGYVSSSWYPERDTAPGMAYAAVHCYGSPAVQDPKGSARNIGRLVETLERGRPDRWRMRELGPGGLASRMPRIVCFEMPIQRLEAKFQMNQEERSGDTRAAIAEIERRGDSELARLMREHNRDRLDRP